MTTLFTHGHRRQSGFTLIELLIALAVFGIAVSAIYGVYISQSRTYTVQNQVTAAQQDLRAGIDLMSRELRMAGFNPLGKGGFGFANHTIADDLSSTFVAFTADMKADGTNEDGDDISFEYIPGAGSAAGALYFTVGDNTDSDSDGKIDALETAADGNTGEKKLMDNVDGFEIVYFLKGNAIPVPSPTPAQIPTIQAVEISILVRTGHPDPQYVNTTTYTSLFGTPWGPFNDGYRRRLLTTIVKCRNL